MIRAAIFDVGGVLVQARWHAVLERWQSVLGAPPDAVLAELFRGFDDTVLVGRCPADEHRNRAAVRLGLSPDRLSAPLDELQMAETMDTELRSYVAALRPRYKTAILSNGWTDKRTAQRRRDLDGLVDEVVISAEVGVAKPAHGIFEIALERLGVSACEAVFVDDDEANVGAARALGLHAVLHKTTAQTVKALDALLPALDSAGPDPCWPPGADTSDPDVSLGSRCASSSPAARSSTRVGSTPCCPSRPAC